MYYRSVGWVNFLYLILNAHLLTLAANDWMFCTEIFYTELRFCIMTCFYLLYIQRPEVQVAQGSYSFKSTEANQL